jgi:hypothetical protein
LGNGVENSLNHRDRFFTAFDLKEPNYVPITDLGLNSPIVTEVLRREKYTLSVPASASRITTVHPRESEIENRLPMIEACRKLDFDAIPAMSDYIAVIKSYKPKFIDRNKFIDQWGRVTQVSATVNTPGALRNTSPRLPSIPTS